MGAASLSLGLTALGGFALIGDQQVPLSGASGTSWLLLVPAYVVAMQLSLGFQRRDNTVTVTLVQLPLAVGITLIAPAYHLAARLIAITAMCLVRRHPPLKTAFNIGLAAMEVGVACLAVQLLRPEGVGPALWAVLLLGLLAGEVLSFVAMNLLFFLLEKPMSRSELHQPVLVALLTSAASTGLAVVTLSAAKTDSSTLFVVAALAAGLAVAYQGHRRLASQQEATEQMYAFVKDLGPIDIDHDHALTVLERVRALLHARHLELTTVQGGTADARRLAVHLAGDPENQQGGAAVELIAPDLRPDCMTTPLLVGRTCLALLRARDRIGTDRGFDMRDLRLLETVATELAVAFDRGRMLRDLETAARTDPLTGLPNLNRTTQDVDGLLASEQAFVLTAVSVDSFREVNDTLGHQVGDELVQEVARRLQRAAPGAVIGRTGGGRFTVAAASDQAGPDAEMFGLRLRSLVEGRVQLGAVTAHVRLSVGCVRAPDHGDCASTLLRRAETAMYSARRVHGGPVLWEPAYEVQGQRRLAVVTALREALAGGGIGAAFQPKICAGSGRVVGVETLARWTHAALGVVEADEFVPLAEAAGLMGSLTSTMLHEAVSACRTWQQTSTSPTGVAVNVSADTLQSASFVGEVAAVLRGAGVDPSLLTLELTEAVVVADPELAARRMGELQALGVRISVDDFGTGYSSLTYLKGLPIDEVKIDKGFIDGLVLDQGDQAIVRAVIDIGHAMGLTVVAEGVEHEDQHALLSRMGVDEMQGYLYAPSMPASAITAWLHAQQQTRTRPTARGAAPVGAL